MAKLLRNPRRWIHCVTLKDMTKPIIWRMEATLTRTGLHLVSQSNNRQQSAHERYRSNSRSVLGIALDKVDGKHRVRRDEPEANQKHGNQHDNGRGRPHVLCRVAEHERARD